MGKYHSSCLYSKLSESEPKFEKTFKTDIKGIFLKNSDPDQNLKSGHKNMFTIYVPWHREYKYFVKKENNFYYHKNLKRIWKGIKSGYWQKYGTIKRKSENNIILSESQVGAARQRRVTRIAPVWLRRQTVANDRYRRKPDLGKNLSG